MSRPQRTRSHQLENESRLAFEQLLPSSWVYRDVTKSDYGIDGEVEVFDGTDATGILFKVQLKGTDSSKLSVGVKQSTISYWLDLRAPVLVCLYSAADKSMRAQWAHTRAVQRPGGKKHPVVSFLQAPVLVHDSWRRIRQEVELIRNWWSGTVDTPIPLRVLECAGDVAAVAPLSLHAALLAESHACRNVIRVTTASSIRDITVFATGSFVGIELPLGLGSFLMDAPPYGRSPRMDHVLANDILVGVGIALGGTQGSLAVEIISSAAAKSTGLSHPEVGLPVAELLIRGCQATVAAELCLRLLTDGDLASIDIAQVFLAIVVQHNEYLPREDGRNLLQKLLGLARTVRESGELEQAATLFYNSSQIAVGLQRYADAVDCLDAAAEANESYLQRAYFHKERAGILWHERRYTDSAEAYRRALSLGAGVEEVGPVLSDALLYSGQYGSCLEVVEKHEQSLSRSNRLAGLNVMIASHVVETLGIVSQERQELTAADEMVAVGGTDPAGLLGVLREKDALCAPAWLGLVTRSANPQFQFDGAVVAAARTNDPELWAMATMLGLVAGETQTRLNCVIDNALFLCRDEYLAAIYGLAEADESRSRELLEIVHDRTILLSGETAPFELRIDGVTIVETT